MYVAFDCAFWWAGGYVHPDKQLTTTSEHRHMTGDHRPPMSYRASQHRTVWSSTASTNPTGRNTSNQTGSTTANLIMVSTDDINDPLVQLTRFSELWFANIQPHMYPIPSSRFGSWALRLSCIPRKNLHTPCQHKLHRQRESLQPFAC